MSILHSIFSKIFGKPAAATAPATPAPVPVPPAAPAEEVPVEATPAPPDNLATDVATVAQSAAPEDAAPTPIAPQPEPVDVEKILGELAAKHPEKLDWKKSIVDLMKLVGMDSSLAERKELAKELGYEGDTSDTAKMNMWLHKQVLRKLAENGGKVPAELLN